MDLPTKFTCNPVSFLHIDINSCFATVEQQANPTLRNKPTVVVARTTPSGCILAASYEAKRLGISTGTRLKEALRICPQLNYLPPDPDKYRFVHKQLKKLLLNYTHLVSAWSIDEFNLDLNYNYKLKQDLVSISKQIKQRIKKEIGEYITVSIGLAPSSFLAKTAAGLEKPDGLQVINKDNFLNTYSKLNITDLCGINHRLAAHLYPIGITTALDLYHTPLDMLKSALGPAAAQYWLLRLRGFQVSLPYSSKPKSFGHSFVLPKELSYQAIIPVLTQLLQKALLRLRRKNFQAKGLSLYLQYKNYPSWGQATSITEPFFDEKTALNLLHRVLIKAPRNLPIKAVAVTLFSVSPQNQLQLGLFTNRVKQKNLSQAIDKINNNWGGLTIAPAPTFLSPNQIPDSIGFGRIREI